MTTDIASLALAVETSQVKEGAASLDKLTAAGGRAETAAGRFGRAQAEAAKTTGLTAFQTQQLSYQLNDFFVQVQAGSSPLSALVQQGSQLNGTFGGVGGTIRAITSLITPMRLAMGGAAAAVGVLSLAALQGSREQDAYSKAIILSGNAAGVTTGQLTEMARAIGSGLSTQGRAAAVLAQLAQSAQVSGAQLQSLTDTALRFERAGGQAVDETVKQFIALGGDPVKASVKLNETTNYLTKSLYDQIKALADQGRASDAAAVALAGYDSALKTRTAELESRLGLLERSWRSVGEGAAWAWDKMLGVGRPATLADQIAAAQKQLADMPEQRRGTVGTQGDARRDAIKQRIADLQMQVYAEGELAAAQQASADAVKRHIADDKKAKEEGLSLFQKEADALRERMALVGLNAERDQVAMQIALGKYGKLSSLQQAELLALASEIDRRNAVIKAQQDETKAREALLKARQDALMASLREAEKMADTNNSLREEIELLGLDENAKTAIEVARVSSARAMLEERRAALMLADATEAERSLLTDQINLLTERERLLTLRQDRKNFLAPISDLPKEAASQTYTDVRDALARAFQDTKNPVKAFAEGLGNAIFSRVTSRLADALATQLVGSTGTGGLFGSLLGGLGGLFGGGVPVGGTTGDFARFDRIATPLAIGTNYVPYDGMRAVLHEGEAVVPKRFNPAAGGTAQGGTRVALTYAPVVRIDSRTDQAQVQQLVAQANAEGQRDMFTKLAAMGVLA